MVTTSEEANLAENMTNCSLNATDVISGDCNKPQKNIVGNQHATKETNSQNNASEEKEDIVKIDVQDKKSKEDSEVVDDNKNHNEQINQEQSLDNQSLVNSDDHVIDCNDHDNIDDEDICYQGDGINDDDHHSNSDDDDSDDEDGWITPENITQVKADYGVSETQCKPTNIAVGCLTTDFAMQVTTDYALTKVKFDYFPETVNWYTRGGKVLDICISET